MKDSTKLLSVFAIAGAFLMVVGTVLHPMHADPNVAAEAFHEYAQSEHWIASHLLQLFGFIFVSGTMVLLSVQMQAGRAKDWSALGLAGAITSLAAASALQAVDGIALKAMVDNWAAAPETEKAALYQAALAVRQIEIGLASNSSILTGLSFIAFGAGFVREPRLANWMGCLAILGGILTFISGIVIAYTGFSPLSMLITMPSSILLVVWLFAIGIKAWNDALFIPLRTPI